MGEKVTRRYTCDLEWMKFPADPEGRASGPVREYKLSPEELAEYDNLRKPTGKAPIVLPPGWGRKRKEAEDNMLENMPIPDSVVHDSEKALENKGSGVDEKEGHPDNVVHDRPRTRMELAREKLSKEEYILRRAHESDKNIYTQLNIAPDIFYRMKKEWELMVNNLPLQLSQSEEPKILTRTTSGLTIAQAVELREELTGDIASLNRILDVAERGAELTERVVRMLEWQRDVHKQALERINEAFERTVLPL